MANVVTMKILFIFFSFVYRFLILTRPFTRFINLIKIPPKRKRDIPTAIVSSLENRAKISAVMLIYGDSASAVFRISRSAETISDATFNGPIT